MNKKGVIAVSAGLFLGLNVYCFTQHGLLDAAVLSNVKTVSIEMPPVQVVPPLIEQNLADLLAKNTIEFQIGSAQLTAKGEQTLRSLLPIVQSDVTSKLEIRGHTDSQGDPQQNQTLSEARAATVANYLREKGIAADRLIASGFGQGLPIADNSTADGRRANRRIEFKVREE